MNITFFMSNNFFGAVFWIILREVQIEFNSGLVLPREEAVNRYFASRLNELSRKVWRGCMVDDLKYPLNLRTVLSGSPDTDFLLSSLTTMGLNVFILKRPHFLESYAPLIYLLFSGK